MCPVTLRVDKKAELAGVKTMVRNEETKRLEKKRLEEVGRLHTHVQIMHAYTGKNGRLASYEIG